MRIRTPFARVGDEYGKYVILFKDIGYISYIRTRGFDTIEPWVIPTPREFWWWFWHKYLRIVWWDVCDRWARLRGKDGWYG